MRRLCVVAVIIAGCCVAVWGETDVEQLRRTLETARDADRIRVLNDLAEATRANAPKEAIAYATEAVELSERLSDTAGRIKSLNNLGIAHYLLAEYDRALEHYSESLALAEQIHDDEAIAAALNNTGIIHYVWGDYDRALEFYSRALEIQRRIGDREAVAKGHNNLGNVYYSAGRYQESLDYLSEALAVYEELGSETLMATTLNNIALVYFQLDLFDEALKRLERALEISERIGDKPALALTLNNTGMVYDEWEKDEESLEYYRRSLEVRREIGDRQGVAICLHNIGMIHASLGDFERSLDYLNDALQVATEINLREIERDIYKGFSETYERMGDFENALGFHKRFKEIDETLFDADTSRRLAELETRFEVGKKDREIEVLRKDREIQRIVRNVTLAGAFVLIVLVVLLYNRYRLKTRADREIRKRNEAQQLAQAEREKAARAELLHVSRVATMGELASALAHELNQPLTAILSNTQATRRLLASGRGRPAELDEALGDIVDGADRAREIIQRLRALMRRGDVTLEPLDVNETLRSVEAFARADARESETDLVMNFAPDLPVVRGDRIQIQQVLLNLVHNGTEAMAAAGGDRRALVVRTSLYDPETVMVAVQDTGPPLDDNVVSRMFEPFFTTKSAGMGMGLPICRTIIEAHGGRLWAVRNPDRGLTVQFTLPRASE